MKRACLLFGIGLLLAACGAGPTARTEPAPTRPTGLLFELQIADLGESLARVNQMAQRLGTAVDLRGPLRAHLRDLSESARLDGPWWLIGFEADGEPGLALVMFSADGADEPGWRAHPLGRWETAIRRLGPTRLVATDNPAWIDANAAWVRGLQPRRGPDLQLELPLAQSLSAQPFETGAESSLLPPQKALLDETWALIRQVESLSVSLDLAADRLVVGVAARPLAQSALGDAIESLEPLPRSAWDRVPRDRLGAVGCRLPTAAWRGVDRVLRAAGGDLAQETSDLRARAFGVLGGDVVLSLGGSTASALAFLRPLAPDALDAFVASTRPEAAFEAGGVAVQRITSEADRPVLVARLDDGLLAAAGAGTRRVLTRLLDGTDAAGPRADADLADALTRTAGASCVAVVDADVAAAALGMRPSGAPPLHLSLGAQQRTLQVSLDLPVAQIQQLLGLWFRRALPVPRLDRREI